MRMRENGLLSRLDINIGCGGMILRLFIGVSILVLTLGAVVLVLLAFLFYG